MPEKFKLFKWLEDAKHSKLELPWLPLFPRSSLKCDEVLRQATLRLIHQHDATRLSRPRLHEDKGATNRVQQSMSWTPTEQQRRLGGLVYCPLHERTSAMSPPALWSNKRTRRICRYGAM
jgi:hypothetical protein